MAAMSLLTALRKAGYKATISQVFANPVAANLAAVVQRIAPAATAVANTAGDPGKAPAASAPAADAVKPMIMLDGASMASLTNLLKGN